MNNTIKKYQDPVIPKDKAFDAAKNAATVAKILGLSRATVCEWGDFVPPLHAYRLVQIFPLLDNRPHPQRRWTDKKQD